MFKLSVIQKALDIRQPERLKNQRIPGHTAACLCTGDSDGGGWGGWMGGGVGDGGEHGGRVAG